MATQLPQAPIEIVINRITDKIKDREGNYGDPTAMFNCIAEFYSVYLHQRYGITVKLDNHDADIMTELFKIARIAHNYTEDNGDDRVAYGLLDQVMRELEKDASTI